MAIFVRSCLGYKTIIIVCLKDIAFNILWYYAFSRIICRVIKVAHFSMLFKLLPFFSTNMLHPSLRRFDIKAHFYEIIPVQTLINFRIATYNSLMPLQGIWLSIFHGTKKSDWTGRIRFFTVTGCKSRAVGFFATCRLSFPHWVHVMCWIGLRTSIHFLSASSVPQSEHSS